MFPSADQIERMVQALERQSEAMKTLAAAFLVISETLTDARDKLGAIRINTD